MATTLLFVSTLDAFASYEPIRNTQAAAQAEALLTFRIQEVVELRSSTRCPGDSRIVRDERLLDPQLPVCKTMNNLVFLDKNECTNTEDAMPMNR